MQVSKYVRETFLQLGDITNESTQLTEDFKDTGDFQSEIRLAAIDGVIQKTLPKEVLSMLKAFEIAGITTAQAAQVMYLTGMFAEQNKK